ncbi:MAG: EamA family transporter, partial [Chloroflexi bacterium]|nr:EamA family transporter [Chloroflexota bacterium]
MNVVLESLILGVAAAIGWGIADFITAVVAKRLGILRSIVGVHVVSILATVGYFLAISDVATVSAANWAFLVALSVIGFAIYLSFYRALQIGPIAIVSPVVSAFAVVVIILALIFTGERLTGIQSLAAAASIGGIVLASVNIRSGMAMRDIVGLGVLLSFVAMFGIGVWQFGIGLLSREIGWFLPIFLGRVITLAMFAPLVAARREWPWQR